MTQYREIRNFEKARAKSQLRKRTIEEMWAYWYLPESMRRHVLKNYAIAFAGESAYYPDLVMFDEKIIIEIDGGYHNGEEQVSFDEYRDLTFCANEFYVIRIKNEDTCVNVAFWERMIEELTKIEPIGCRATLSGYIEEIKEMRDAEIRSWTSLNDIPEINMANVHRHKRVRNLYELVA